MLSVVVVMVAQAISGIAKDLSKMSAKSAIKSVVASVQMPSLSGGKTSQVEHQLFQWVAILTGSKNALKGLGFFAGGLLLATVGFAGSVTTLAALIGVALLATINLPAEIGKMKRKPAFAQLFAKSEAINWLSRGPFLFIRRPRCLVCGGLAGVSRSGPGLALLGSGRLYGALGDWLWHRPGFSPCPAPYLG
jgi:hypothetical protein